MVDSRENNAINRDAFHVTWWAPHPAIFRRFRIDGVDLTGRRRNVWTPKPFMTAWLRGITGRVFKIPCANPESEHLRLRDPSATLSSRTKRAHAAYVRTCRTSFFSPSLPPLPLLAVSLSGSLAFLCSRGETEWPGEEHEYEPSQMNRARACAPSLILSHDRNLFRLRSPLFLAVSQASGGRKKVLALETARKPARKSRGGEKSFSRSSSFALIVRPAYLFLSFSLHGSVPRRQKLSREGSREKQIRSSVYGTILFIQN